ncbi:Uncharacterised protein [Mycobacteroides abscessus subsp. abscessus]|nr:Uncharacterised protein [Mycobacteroides abscessus subsp. abscessus]
MRSRRVSVPSTTCRIGLIDNADPSILLAALIRPLLRRLSRFCTQSSDSTVAAWRMAASYARSRSAPSRAACAAAMATNPTANPTDRESTTRTCPE